MTREERNAYVNEWMKRDRLKNPEKYREAARRKYKKHREQIIAKAVAYHAANRERIVNRKRAKWHSATPEYRWAATMLRNYGLSVDEYHRILEMQGGVCAICSQPPAEGKKLSVDHCHKTGQVRGLLCAKCNFAIGHLCDDVKLVKKAVDYLINHAKV